MPAVSVIICAFNPRIEYLSRVLRALDAQSLDKANWELLLVDNASESRLSERWDLSWHPRAKHLLEPEPGLTAARLRGIRESVGDVLVFVDDDNVLASDYLETAGALLSECPHLGAIGAGSLLPEFGVPPAPELVPYLGALALREISGACWSNNTNDGNSVPWGAGLCVSRQVAMAYEPLLTSLGARDLVDRRPGRLYGNGDVAFSWCSVCCGLGFGVFPQLRISHLIAPERLTREYFLKLARDSSYSNSVLDYLWAGRKPGAGTDELSFVVRLVLRGLRRGLFAMRHSWAAARGAAQARALIRLRELRPVGQWPRGLGPADSTMKGGPIVGRVGLQSNSSRPSRNVTPFTIRCPRDRS